MKFLAALAVSSFVFLGNTPLASQQPQAVVPSSDRVVKIDLAIVSSIRDIEVPARVKGFLSQVNFREGDQVQQGDVIAQLDTISIDGELEAAQIRLDNARLQANDNTPVEYAEASWETAYQEYQTDRELRRTGSVTPQELERKKLTAKQAELQVVRSKAQKEIDAGTVRIEEQSVKSVKELKKRHSIDAQFSGQIMSLEREEGEFVQEGQTVVRLVDLSQVKVEGYVNSSEFNAPELKNRPVKVMLRLAGGEVAEFQGFVKAIGLDYQLGIDGSSTFIVEAEVENKQRNEEWLLHPGARVSMDIQLDPR